jgi:NAD(P)H-hydrate repair Nnr-like enzyme with NAD(P)H-hydrate epimerase domain
VSALPGWLDPLYEAAEMRAADAWAIEEQGVAQDDLMARAALGLARVAATLSTSGPVRVVVGKGNNGGDGRVAAGLLREDGCEVDVIDGTEPFDPAELDGSGAVLDCLLGTGFEGVPREPVASAIAAINAYDGAVVACDVPSGVNASTGEVEGEAVRADATATFHGPKLGLYVEPGKGHAGSVEVVEIGIPRGFPAPGASGLITDRVLDLYPHRPRSGSKFESGVVVVVGG